MWTANYILNLAQDNEHTQSWDFHPLFLVSIRQTDRMALFLTKAAQCGVRMHGSMFTGSDGICISKTERVGILPTPSKLRIIFVLLTGHGQHTLLDIQNHFVVDSARTVSRTASIRI